MLNISFRKWKAKKRKYALGKQHIEFLTSPTTLLRQAGMSLKERAKAFHRQFPDRWTYPVKISRLYKQHGIKQRKVRISKSAGNQTLQKHMTELDQCRAQVKAAMAEGLPIVYADETVFTKHTMMASDYIKTHNAVAIDGMRTY